VTSRYDRGLQASGRVTHAPRQPAASRPTRKPAPASRQSAAQLEAQGHQLLDQNQYASAIPLLQQAIRATGETPSACAQPTSQNCLTLAFALYDLGVAYRLSGNPSAAVPILEQRLQIDNQQGAVAYELKLAQDTTPSTATATQLEARGHSLLQSGHYTSAIPVLQQAIKTTAENPGACAQPTTQSCLTYAFALYDLGVALRLSGNPSAAVPILQQRLRIGVARDVVAQELELAQSASQ
jgi:tetratricopeptide (TPR) repeat protein